MSRSLQWRHGLVVVCYRVGALNIAVHAWDPLKEAAIIFMTSTTIWPQLNKREGTQLHTSIENRIKIYWASVSRPCLKLCNPMDCSMPGYPVHHNSQSLLKLMSFKSVMPSNQLILCCPLLLPPSIFPSIRVFSESALHIRWPKYWSFSFSNSSSNEYSRKIPWRRKWQPTPVFLPGKSHRQRSLVGYSPCGWKELDTTEQLNNPS